MGPAETGEEWWFADAGERIGYSFRIIFLFYCEKKKDDDEETEDEKMSE
jgi:hypothetical protein